MYLFINFNVLAVLGLKLVSAKSLPRTNDLASSIPNVLLYKDVKAQINPLLEKIASDLWKIYDENDTSNVNLDTLKSNIQKVDEEYNIYNDEGLSIINELLDRELLKPENIRNLYNEKYIDKYGKSKP